MTSLNKYINSLKIGDEVIVSYDAVGTANNYAGTKVEITNIIINKPGYLDHLKVKNSDVKEMFLLITENNCEIEIPDIKKEIVAYKLIKRIPGCSVGNIYKKNKDGFWICDDGFWEFKDEEIVDEEFFEPIYGDEFKIGDWVINDDCARPIANKIVSINETHYQCKNGSKKGYLGFNKKEKLRLATKEEIAQAIKQATKKVIVKMASSSGDFELEIAPGRIYYAPENKELPISFIDKIIASCHNFIGKKSYNDVIYDIEVESTTINVGCKNDTLRSEWELVRKTYNQLTYGK